MLKSDDLVKPVVFGLSSENLTQDEMRFLKKHNPLGIILFTRNIKNLAQIRNLTRSISDILERPNVPIFIDQEGGRVCRLKPPLFMDCPNMQHFVSLVQENPDHGIRALGKHSLKLGQELLKLGINFNCAPVADLLFPDADKIIGDRSFGSDPIFVAKLARVMAENLLEANVFPVIKHIPGHGRANVDSHLSLPIVHTELEELEQTDFLAFKELNDLPFAMTAHVTFSALSDLPVTISPDAISYIRDEIGFSNILISDDLSMKALKGSLSELAVKSLDAGVDIVLHCNGNLPEMIEIANSIQYANSDLIDKFHSLSFIS